MTVKQLSYLGLVLGVLSGRAIAQVPSILEPSWEAGEKPPIWVSAEAAADPETIVNLDLIDSRHLHRYVEQQQKLWRDRAQAGTLWKGGRPVVTTIPQGECELDVLSFAHRGGDKPRGTLADLKAHSKSIIRGTIRSLAPGFAFGEPVTLLGVEAAEVIKGDAPTSLIFIDYPVARFRIGPYYFCNGEKGYEPTVGDEVVLFDYLGPTGRDSLLYLPSLDQLFFASQRGGLFLPSRLKDSRELRGVKTLAEVVTRLHVLDGSGRRALGSGP